MNCKEIHIAAKYGSGPSTISAAEAEDHIKSCLACQRLLLSERLAPAIIKAASASSLEGAPTNSNAMLIGRIKRRIQEIREQRSSSWEAAVEAMSGWLAAFAVAAIILVVGAIGWRPSEMATMASDFDFAAQNPDERIINDFSGSVLADDAHKGGRGNDNPYVDK
ncbi:MAG: hypothetical protein J2P21_27100 [Chloracidobacterium sp.]|nr:hypothetical protein [Chloracidobacterium sp.]